MSTLSSANVTDINLVLKERTHMRLCINMLIFTHNLGNWLMSTHQSMKVTMRTRQLVTELLNTACGLDGAISVSVSCTGIQSLTDYVPFSVTVTWIIVHQSD